MAKNRTEILNSIKTRLENFKNNPLLNPDFSEMSEELSVAVSDVQGVIIDSLFDLECIETASKHESIAKLMETHDDMEQEMLDAFETLYPTEMPSNFYLNTGISEEEANSINDVLSEDEES